LDEQQFLARKILCQVIEPFEQSIFPCRNPWSRQPPNDVNATGEGGTHPGLSGQTHSPVVAEKNQHSAWR
ncbi:hypothetical protein, partial [Thiolapillus sp.]|uniref:hypothetical protein n=2 Tax=Thiolapillus sp. TaxID=2017437 RepID=UPI003AF4754F